MVKNELIKKCKFYRGEETFPSEMSNTMYAFLFWEAEWAYVTYYNTQEEENAIKAYLEAGLGGANLEITTPLLAWLFAIYCKGADIDITTAAVYFRKRVLPAYVASTSRMI